MRREHKDLAAGRWGDLTFLEQMANVGGEVERALKWRAKNNAEYSQKAFERALELLDLTMNCRSPLSRLKEVARVREALVDFFFGENEFESSERSWKRYFLPFVYAARRYH